jgi:hypothetical protein
MTKVLRVLKVLESEANVCITLDRSTQPGTLEDVESAGRRMRIREALANDANHGADAVGRPWSKSRTETWPRLNKRLVVGKQSHSV